VWSFRDVTDRYRSEEAIRDAERRYRTLVEQIPAVTYVDAIDADSSAIYMSPQVETMLGYPVQRWHDEPDLWIRLLHPEDRESVLAEHRRTNETGAPFRIEYRVLDRNGRDVWIHDEATMFRDEEGRPLFWQGVMFDITDRKRAEHQLEQAWQKELEAGQRLRALDEMKNTFLEAVSHELRTPLTAVLGSATSSCRRKSGTIWSGASRPMLASSTGSCPTCSISTGWRGGSWSPSDTPPTSARSSRESWRRRRSSAITRSRWRPSRW
jgi:PAS domain S-box-containing protein